jgi:uncharacterized protein YndB with AHSA1/START domain
MTTQVAGTSVLTSVVVEAPIERAFSVFTDGIDTWWDRTHTIGAEPLARVVLEPRVGGRAYGVGTGGTESDWGRVLAYEPPERVVFSWDISTAWKYQADPEKTSEVEVRFIAQGPTRTLVELEHTHLDRHGDGWELMRDAVGSPGGWPSGMHDYAAAAAS